MKSLSVIKACLSGRHDKLGGGACDFHAVKSAKQCYYAQCNLITQPRSICSKLNYNAVPHSSVTVNFQYQSQETWR